jgi:uncharacterized protein
MLRIKFFLVLASMLLTSCTKSEPYMGILWKLQKDDATAYIMGVGHVTLNENNKSSKVAKELFLSSSRLVLEGDVTQKNYSEIDLAVGQDWMGNLNKNASDVLIGWKDSGWISEQVYSNMRKKHIFATYSFIKSAVSSAELNKLAKVNFRNHTLMPGPESNFLQMASEFSKQTGYLESLTASLNAWDRTCSTKQDNSDLILGLREYAVNGISILEEFVELDMALIRGDIDAITKWQNTNLSKWPDEALVERCVNIPRNHDWVKKINAGLVANDKSFIVVGAAHLLGQSSVLELLRTEGVTVTPVNQK